MVYCVRNGVLSGWFVLYAFGLATYHEPVFVVPCVLAGAVALAVLRWAEAPHALRYPRSIRRGHAALAAIALAAAVVGVAASSTALSQRSDAVAAAVVISPLAVYFLATAILAWRAIARPSPRHTAAIPVVVYLGWLPSAMLVPWEWIIHGDGAGWHAIGIRVALWVLLAVGGLLCWVATLATTERELPVAHLRR